MPRGDRTGPRGMGPMSGRGAGFCAGYAGPGYAAGAGYGPGGAGMGRGMGRGMYGGGGGRGRRNAYQATGVPRWGRGGRFGGGYADPVPFVEPDPAVESRALRYEAEVLQAELEAIKARLADLEGEREDA
jgi:hypothetical protein